MKIGELAKAAHVEVETIRYYERIGLLPAPSRSPNGYRAYAGGHLERLAFIRAEIRDLARDVEPYAERGQLDDDQEAAVAALAATLTAKVLGVSAA